MKNGLTRCLLVLGLALAAAACRSTPEVKAPSADLPLIAVLPFENQSADIEAADKVRNAVYEEFKTRGYRLVELETIDSGLKTLGISEGGQLPALTAEKLGAAIPAEVFCYGNVLEFNFKSVVAVSQKKVALELKLVKAGTVTVLFEGSEEGISSTAGTDAAGRLAFNVVGKIFKSVKSGAKNLVSPGSGQAADVTDKLADVDLTRETGDAIRKLLDKYQKSKD